MIVKFGALTSEKEVHTEPVSANPRPLARRIPPTHLLPDWGAGDWAELGGSSGERWRWGGGPGRWRWRGAEGWHGAVTVAVARWRSLAGLLMTPADVDGAPLMLIRLTRQPAQAHGDCPPANAHRCAASPPHPRPMSST